MKKIVLTLAIMGTMMACNKESDVIDPTAASGLTVNAEDVAAIIQSDVAQQSGGLYTLISDIATLAYNRNNASYCGKTKDSTVTKKSSGTYPNVSYSYTQAWSWTLNCTSAKAPSNLTYKTTLNGQYKVPSTSSVDSGTGDFVVSGLEPLSPNYVMNGTYNRKGSQTVNVSTEKTLTSDLALSAVNIQVNKSTLKVQAGGTASFVISGKSNTGKTFNFTGSIKFNGDGTITITINGKSTTVPVS
jgi:hypothetical protein